MANHQHILLPLQFLQKRKRKERLKQPIAILLETKTDVHKLCIPHHNDRLQSVDQVFIGLSLGVAVVVLVLVTERKLSRKLLLNLLIRLGFTLTLGEGGGAEEGDGRWEV